jgi:DNA-binding IclR family transcriptional regulator
MSSQPNHGVLDGLLCLEALAVAGEGVGTRALARQLGLHPVRVNRLLKSLAEKGFARQDADRRYMPGPAFHVLAALATHGSGLLRRALPHLQALAVSQNATVALGVLWRDQVCYLYHGDARTPPAEALGRTQLHPAATSSIGVILMDPARGHACLRHGTEARPHLSIAVPVANPAIAGLACTAVPVTTHLPPLIERLHATATEIAHA